MGLVRVAQERDFRVDPGTINTTYNRVINERTVPQALYDVVAVTVDATLAAVDVTFTHGGYTKVVAAGSAVTLVPAGGKPLGDYSLSTTASEANVELIEHGERVVMMPQEQAPPEDRTPNTRGF